MLGTHAGDEQLECLQLFFLLNLRGLSCVCGNLAICGISFIRILIICSTGGQVSWLRYIIISNSLRKDYVDRERVAGADRFANIPKDPAC